MNTALFIYLINSGNREEVAWDPQVPLLEGWFGSKCSEGDGGMEYLEGSPSASGGAVLGSDVPQVFFTRAAENPRALRLHQGHSFCMRLKKGANMMH